MAAAAAEAKIISQTEWYEMERICTFTFRTDGAPSTRRLSSLSTFYQIISIKSFIITQTQSESTLLGIIFVVHCSNSRRKWMNRIEWNWIINKCASGWEIDYIDTHYMRMYSILCNVYFCIDSEMRHAKIYELFHNVIFFWCWWLAKIGRERRQRGPI